MSTLTSRVVAGCARSPAPATISRGGAPGRVARRRAPNSPSRSRSMVTRPVRASAGPVDGFIPAIDAAARDVAASNPPLATSSLHRVDPIADVAVDAWSVSGGTTLGVRFAGVETKLFQAGLSRTSYISTSSVRTRHEHHQRPTSAPGSSSSSSSQPSRPASPPRPSTETSSQTSIYYTEAARVYSP